MKLKQMMLCTAFVVAMAFGAATASWGTPPYPSVKLAISGTLYYTTNNGTNMSVPIKEVSYTGQSLINLLNASSDATYTILHVTGKSRIPSGSHFLWNPCDGSLIITNGNGFAFPLEGSFVVLNSTNDYTYGFLDVNSNQFVGTYKLNTKTSAGTETDRTGVYFYFYDGTSHTNNEMEIYGTAVLRWIYGTAKNGSQKATLSATISGCGNMDCYVNGYDAVPKLFSITGHGSGSEATNAVPFYYERLLGP